MRIEKEIFKRQQPDIQKLRDYGFQNIEGTYIFEKSLGKDDFKIVVSVDNSNEFVAKVIDGFDGEEYIPVHLENQQGAYVSQVRGLFVEILEDIKEKCCISLPYIFHQTNSIHQYINEKYHVRDEHIFSKFPNTAVYRHADNQKWFANVQIVDGTVFGKEAGEVEIFSMKCDDTSCVDHVSIFPGYHMSKKSWISIIMDGSIANEIVYSLLDRSYALTQPHTNANGYWLIPSNPKYYDIVHAFSVSELLYWHQSAKMKLGDIVYIYSGLPNGKILYKTEIVESDLHFPSDPRTHMRLKRLRYYNQYPISREVMAKFGVKTVRNARYMPMELIQEIEKYYPE